jgi:hypothetical protein
MAVAGASGEARIASSASRAPATRAESSCPVAVTAKTFSRVRSTRTPRFCRTHAASDGPAWRDGERSCGSTPVGRRRRGGARPPPALVDRRAILVSMPPGGTAGGGQRGLLAIAFAWPEPSDPIEADWRVPCSGALREPSLPRLPRSGRVTNVRLLSGAAGGAAISVQHQRREPRAATSVARGLGLWAAAHGLTRGPLARCPGAVTGGWAG